ncbi:hypothetical protein AVEN_23500-1, partial [Araneus ventricosus]
DVPIYTDLILVDVACWQVEYAHARATSEHGDCDVTHELNAFLVEYVETDVTHYPCVTHVQRRCSAANSRKRGVAGDAACRQQAIMKRERRVAETDEERNLRFSTIAQSGQDKRTK